MATKSGWQICQPLFLFCMDAYGLHKNARQSGYEEQGVYGQADDGEYAEVFQYGFDIGSRLLQSHLRSVAHSVASVLYQVEAFLYRVEVEQCQQHVNNAKQCARIAAVGRDEEQHDSDDEEQCDSDCAKYCHELQPLSCCQQVILDVFCDS